MRTIFLSVPSGHSAANLLRSQVFSTLLKVEPRLQIVILSPLVYDSRFTSEFQHPRVSFELLHPHNSKLLEWAVYSVLSEQFLMSSRLEAVRLQRDRARLSHDGRLRRLLLPVKAMLCRMPISRAAWFKVSQLVAGFRVYRGLYEKYCPDFLVTATAGLMHTEIPLIHEAKRQRVPQVAVDLSWDNLLSKYQTIQPVDYLVVWNQIMRDEAIRYHGYSADQIVVAGVAHFDRYFLRCGIPTRSEFFKAIGADESRKLITLATTPPETYQYIGRIIETISRAIREKEIKIPAQLLVRVHPRDWIDSYQALKSLPYVMIEKPFKQMQAPPGNSEFDVLFPTDEDRAHLAGTLAHSDVIINFASTTTIESFIFDTPVINVGFDGGEILPLPLSIQRYYHYEHYRPILQARAVKVADSPEDLIDKIQDYLECPWIDSEGRHTVVTKLCGFTDGRSGERVAHAILSVLNLVANPRKQPQNFVADN